jgi:hypothetical protein
MGFHFFNNIHLDETSHLSFFINSLSYHQKSYVIAHLLKIKLSLGIHITMLALWRKNQLYEK